MQTIKIDTSAFFRKYRMQPRADYRSTFVFQLIADEIEVEEVTVKNSPYFVAVREAQKAAAAAQAEAIKLIA